MCLDRQGQFLSQAVLRQDFDCRSLATFVRRSDRRVRGQKAATTFALRIQREAQAHARRLGCSPSGARFWGIAQCWLADQHAQEGKLGLTQAAALMGEVSLDTLRRQFKRFADVGLPVQQVTWGERGRGLQSEWVLGFFAPTFAEVVAEKQEQKSSRRLKLSKAKNPQNASHLSPSESSSSKNPPTETTQARQGESVAVAGVEEKKLLVEAIKQACPDFNPARARKALGSLRFKPEDLDLMAKGIGNVLATLRKESTNPAGLLCYRLKTEPGRVMADARKAAKHARPFVEVSLPERIQGSPEAREAYQRWRQLDLEPTAPDSPGYLDHLDRKNIALREFLSLGEGLLPEQRCERMREALATTLRDAGLFKGSLLWERGWRHHWTMAVFQELGLNPPTR